MSVQSRYWILIAVVVAVFLIVILTSRHYHVSKITKRGTYKSNKLVPVIDNGLLKNIQNMNNMNKLQSNPAISQNVAQLNQQESYKKYKKQLCELDKSRLTFLEKFDFSKQTNDQIEDALHAVIMDPTDTVCKEKHRFGGSYLSYCHYVDGGKYVCMDELIYDIENNECVIFSFGIANDWTFEDMMDNLGCTVFAFDPSVNFPSKRGRNITFEKLGVAAKKDQDKLMDTLGNILKKYHYENTKISYLKMDIESSELTGLPQWLSDGALKYVQQIAVEVHLSGTETTIEFLKTMQRLYFEGDYRLISYEPNGCWYNFIDKKKFYYLSEIVLKKVNQEHKVMEKNCEVLGL